MSAFFDLVGLTMTPERFFEKRAARDGDPFRVCVPPLGEVLVTGHPDGVRDVFSAPAEAFVPAGPNPVEPLLGPGSLILLGGERHRRERKLMTPPFHGERIRTYGRIMADRARAAMQAYRPGERIVAQDVARAITLDVIVRAVFGVRGREATAAFQRATVAMLDAYTAQLVAFPWLRRTFGGVGPWARFVRARRAFVELLRAEVAQRRESGGPEREDVLSLLLGARYEDGQPLSDDDLLDELCTILVAGHETTATGIVWALYFVHRAPEILARLDEELKSAEDADALAELPFLGAVCNEALRLHPVVPIALRRLTRGLRVRGVEVPAGGLVAVAVTLLHTRDEIWERPESFAPERFLAKKYSPFEFAPFGGGSRRCLGAAFASYEMRIILGTLLRHARFRPIGARLPRRVIRNITMAPSDPIELTVAERGAVREA